MSADKSSSQTVAVAPEVTSDGRRGLTIIYTGNGKGKTSASLGLIMRASAMGWKIAFLQFIKTWDFLSEHKTLHERFPEVQHELFGEGFVGIMGDQKPRQAHVVAAEVGLEKAKKYITDRSFDLVILDELCGTVTGGLLAETTILELMKNKPPSLHLVLTGRGATEEMIRLADLVTEMREVKHPYQAGIQAQRGIDF